MSYVFDLRSKYYFSFFTKFCIGCICVIFFLYGIQYTLQPKGLLKANILKLYEKEEIQELNEVLEDDDISLEDNSLTEDQLKSEIENILPNFPHINKDLKSYKDRRYNKTCATYTSPLSIKFSNSYWQVQRTKYGTFLLFNAYLDNRKENSLGPTIRIIGMIKTPKLNATTYCQIWFNDTKVPVIVKTYQHNPLFQQVVPPDSYCPYLISCVLPPKFNKSVPESISLVEGKCDNATNRLRVIYDNPGIKEEFAVCVKGLSFPNDISRRLVEWIELVSATGVNKIFLYELQIHPNIRKVLDYYEKKDQVQVSLLSLSGDYPNAPFLQHFYIAKETFRKRLNEIIPYNDCFYKNMYKYKYIIPIDTDEVVVPSKDANLTSMMDRVKMKLLAKGKKEIFASYNVGNAHFINNTDDDKTIPKYMYILRHTYRRKEIHEHKYVKSILNTDKVLKVFNHFPYGCLNRGPCKASHIDSEDGLLQHYRRTCSYTCKIDNTSIVHDKRIWKYRNIITPRVKNTLVNTGLIKNY